MKTRIILLALFCSTIVHAQSIIDQVFKTFCVKLNHHITYQVDFVKQ